MVELFANSGDPDQTPHSAASDLGLHCLPNTQSLLWVSRLQWVNLASVQNCPGQFQGIKKVLQKRKKKKCYKFASHGHLYILKKKYQHFQVEK